MLILELYTDNPLTSSIKNVILHHMFEHDSKFSTNQEHEIPKGYTQIDVEDLDADAFPEIFLIVDGKPVLYTRDSDDLKKIDAEVLKGKLFIRTPEPRPSSYLNKEEMIEDIKRTIQQKLDRNSRKS